MADDRWQAVRALFERAIDEQPPDLAAWLDGQAEVDWQVREEVLSLACHHRSAHTFLEKPAGDLLSRLLDDDTPKPGDTVGQYRLIREIGRGGMGRVFLARDERLGRLVALKALPPELTGDPSHRERLRREARAAANLTHPGICTIYAFEELDGGVFIAAEFIDGQTLRDEIKSGRLPSEAEVARTARDLAMALAHAHSHGVTHRDLKPENVMRTRAGELKVLDFGLARVDSPADDIREAVTRPGTILGTPAYMAPEQLNGLPADPRSDVYAFGLVIAEYAAGTHPFQAATPLALIGRMLEGEPDRLIDRRPDLPPSVTAVVERCLARSPADRFTSAAGIVAALEGSVAVPTPGRIASWWRTHQLLLMAVYLAGCGLAWQIKEWQPGSAAVLFVAASILATVAAVFRGHLLFTDRINRPALEAEHRRAMRVTLATDLLLALVLAADGLILSAGRPLAAVLTLGLGIGVGLARLVIEPATTAAYLRRRHPG